MKRATYTISSLALGILFLACDDGPTGADSSVKPVTPISSSNSGANSSGGQMRPSSEPVRTEGEDSISPPGSDTLDGSVVQMDDATSGSSDSSGADPDESVDRNETMNSTDAEQTVPEGGNPESGGTASGPSDSGDDNWNLPYHRCVFGATHNSYSGGDRGSIIEQLNSGIRGLELDFHDDDYGQRPDWQVGHFSPGQDVLLNNGNPSSEALTSWLRIINNWSRDHPGHGPITLVLDSKDPLDDNDSPEKGNLGALNQRLKNMFRERLVFARDLPDIWPPVSSLKDRILVVLSGHSNTRARYIRDEGIHPAIAHNENGQIVEVHESRNGFIWYWTGEIRPDNRIDWLHHGRLGRGRTPAVVLTADGTIVLAYSDGFVPELRYQIGTIRVNSTVNWSDSQRYDNGVLPTLFLRANGSIKEIHKSENNDQNWSWDGELQNGQITWRNNVRTNTNRYPVNRSGLFEVFSNNDRFGQGDTLQISYDNGPLVTIQYEQVMFTEFQNGDGDEVRDRARFFAHAANDDAFVRRWSDRGPVRLWSFGADDADLEPWPAFPSTDHPQEVWYQSGLRRQTFIR